MVNSAPWSTLSSCCRFASSRAWTDERGACETDQASYAERDGPRAPATYGGVAGLLAADIAKGVIRGERCATVGLLDSVQVHPVHGVEGIRLVVWRVDLDEHPD
jgi:hypothetical protein